MSRNKGTIFLVSLVTLQFLGVGIWLPTHRDTDFSVWPGQAKVLEHRDNGPCRDIPLSPDEYCAICVAAQSRVSFNPDSYTFEKLHLVGQIELSASVAPSQQLPFDSFSRRGPPSSPLG